MKDPSAYLIVTGNEILTGKTKDINGQLVMKKARELGLRLTGVTYLPDDIDRIAFTVRRAKEDLKPTFIFISGGIGPTHDDVTMAGVAKGLNRPIIRNKKLSENLKHLYEERFNDCVLKMADVPEGTDLIWAGKLMFPILKIENIYCFPGGPNLFEEKFKAIANRFVGGEEYIQVKISVNLEEAQLAGILGRLNNEYNNLMIGSYPRYDEDRWWTMVTFDGKGMHNLKNIVQKFKEELNDQSLIENIEYE